MMMPRGVLDRFQKQTGPPDWRIYWMRCGSTSFRAAQRCPVQPGPAVLPHGDSIGSPGGQGKERDVAIRPL